MHPFEPAINAAVNAVEERFSEIEAARASKPDDWQALYLTAFWNGDSALVLLKPEKITPTDITVKADGELQEYTGGRGVLAVLLRNSASHVVVDYNAGSTAAQMTLPIVPL